MGIFGTLGKLGTLGILPKSGKPIKEQRLWGKQWAYKWLQLLPVLCVLVFLFAGALFIALLQSLGFAPWLGINEFPDMRYFKALLTDHAFWHALALTLYYACVATIIALLLGVALAMALIKIFPGKALYKYIYKLPLMIPYSVGIALAIIMLGNGGILSRFAEFFGLISDPSEFPLILKTHYGWGIIAVYVWKQTPFVTLTIYAVLLGIGRQTQEAAAVLGASQWQIFIHVTLPQIAPGIMSSTLIIFAFNIGAFEAPFLLGGGFPDTLPVMAWRYFNDADYTLQLRGMAVIVCLTVICAIVLYSYIALYRHYERRIGRL